MAGPGRTGLSGLASIHVVELGGEAAARAGRVLADLGARVTRVSPAGRADVLAARRANWLAWTYGKQLVTLDDDGAAELAVSDAHIVLDTPHEPDTIVLDPSCAPHASWVRITPFGMDGPRARWRASDLGVMAASGNMYPTGDPDRAPVRAVEPTSLGHVAGEAAFAALSRARERAAADRRRVGPGVRDDREHGRRRALLPLRHAGSPHRRSHRPDSRDLADRRRLRELRHPRWRLARAVDADDREARARRRDRSSRCSTRTGPHGRPSTPRRRSSIASRRRSAATSRRAR